MMGWWRKLRRGRGGPGDVPDYYREGLKLAGEGKLHEALTSFRLRLRQRPDDPEILQQMAVVYTRIGMPEEAIKHYEKAIELGVETSGAHYGLAFLLLRQGDTEGAQRHLQIFLERPPEDPEAAQHVAHARQTLARLERADDQGAGDQPGDAAR